MFTSLMVCWESWLCGFIVFIKYGEISPIISSVFPDLLPFLELYICIRPLDVMISFGSLSIKFRYLCFFKLWSLISDTQWTLFRFPSVSCGLDSTFIWSLGAIVGLIWFVCLPTKITVLSSENCYIFVSYDRK